MATLVLCQGAPPHETFVPACRSRLKPGRIALEPLIVDQLFDPLPWIIWLIWRPQQPIHAAIWRLRVGQRDRLIL